MLVKGRNGGSMSKSLSRLLYLISILIAAVGSFALARGYLGAGLAPIGEAVLVHPGSAVVGLILCGLAGLIALVAWIGALVRMAQLHRWGWFVFLLIFSGITMLFYIFFGPKTSASPSISAQTPPYSGFGD